MAVLILGAAKEIADAMFPLSWPWCQPTCYPDVFDMLADVVGVAVAAASIWMVQLVTAKFIVT